MLLPLASVIIVNHNGIEFVGPCLNAVLASDYANLEVIFVDNASTDASLEYVRRNFQEEKRLRLVENLGSFGPAVGRNSGAKIAHGKYLIFLDNDTRVTSDAVSQLVKVLEQDNTIGAAQAKLLRMGTRNYDCAGDYLGSFGFLSGRSKGETDTGQFDFTADILSAKSAASIIRKDLFEDIGGFDADFYMYLEETDLSWRVWLHGLRVVFAPDSVIYHAFNTPKKEFKRYYSKYIVRYYGCRNYISTLIKNLEWANIIAILPLHIGCWFSLATLFMLKGNFSDSFYIIKGIGWNFLNIHSLLEKRCQINRQIRKVRDRDILSKVKDKARLGWNFAKAFNYLTGKTFGRDKPVKHATPVNSLMR